MPKRHKRPPHLSIFLLVVAGLAMAWMAAGWDGLFAIERDANAFASLNENLIRQDAPKKFPYGRSGAAKAPHGIDEVLVSHRESLLALRNKVDLLAGGPPCQGFSSAGVVANDPRNHLTSSYLEFVNLVQPKIVLIENVKGIAIDFDDEESEDGKVNYARKIIQALSVEYNVSAEVLDTSTFGGTSETEEILSSDCGKMPSSTIKIRRSL